MPKKLEKTEEVVEKPNLVKSETAKIEKNRCQVFNDKGKFVREYTFAEHGEKFDDNAKEYAKKIGGTYQYPILLR